MLKTKYFLSFCIPVHNEAEVISLMIKKIQTDLKKILKDKSFEILIVENGSTDNTLSKLRGVKDKNIKIISLAKKSHGLALKTAIINAKGENILLTAIDLPFGFSDLNEMLKISNNYPLIFGSKSHSESVIYTSASRKIASSIYRLFLKKLFSIHVGDTQGTVFLKKTDILPILKFCDSSNAFFSAQLAIYSEREDIKITEVPVIMDKKILRKSKYNIFSNGYEMLLSMLKTYIDLKFNYINQRRLNDFII
nr:glycosyltransferase family 2 protein [Candidatus Levybacteria bacterium]